MKGFRQEPPEPPQQVPAWLSPAARAIYIELTRDLCAAGVPIKVVDQHTMAATAHCFAEMVVWTKRERAARCLDRRIECAAIARKLRTQCLGWLECLGASPRSRARLHLGLPTTTTPPAAGSVMDILRQKALRDRPN
jgi:hypothetical protein